MVTQIKNLRLYARSEYDDDNYFQHDLFNQEIPDAPVVQNEFKRILLRGDGSGGSIAYDVVFNRVMQPVFNGVTRIKPIIHFINGEYWGISAIRDRFDDRHFALNFNLDEDNVVIVDCKGNNCDLKEGENADYSDFIAMRDFIINNDMSNIANYIQVRDMLDITSFIDHMVMKVYTADNSYERLFWKVRNPENNNYGDGKWRLTTQDFEAAMKTNTNWLQHWTDVALSDNESFFKNLIVNEEFKIQYINRFADLLNTVYSEEYFNEIVNQTFDEVSPYLVEDENRFPKQDFYEPVEQQDLLDWGTSRPAFQLNQLKDFFSIAELLDINLDVSNDNAGYIHISTIDVESATPGVAQIAYPWTGKYFHNIPIKLKAKAKPGYTFSHWSGDVSDSNAVIEITPTIDMQLKAHFNAFQSPQEVVYFWLMDKNISNDTPLEFLDATYSSNGLNASIDYSSCLAGYPFTPNDPNWRKASIERKNKPTDLNYHAEANNNIAYPDVEMRGVQIRQPFRSGGLENTLVFEVPTNVLENINFSFAVMSNGAAENLLLDYWNGTEWTTDDLVDASRSITETYQVMDFDFSMVAAANDNAGFKIRMRFDGNDMTVDNSDEMILNNIALKGSKILTTEKFEHPENIKVYPNPTKNLLTIESTQPVKAIGVYNIYGEEIQRIHPNDLKSTVDLASVASGVYLLKIVSANSEQTIRVVKQPF